MSEEPIIGGPHEVERQYHSEPSRNAIRQGREFTCEKCGEEFVSAWSDEEARAEATALFGKKGEEATAVVCDSCFKELLRWASEKGLL